MGFSLSTYVPDIIMPKPKIFLKGTKASRRISDIGNRASQVSALLCPLAGETPQMGAHGSKEKNYQWQKSNTRLSQNVKINFGTKGEATPMNQPTDTNYEHELFISILLHGMLRATPERDQQSVTRQYLDDDPCDRGLDDARAARVIHKIANLAPALLEALTPDERRLINHVISFAGDFGYQPDPTELGALVRQDPDPGGQLAVLVGYSHHWRSFCRLINSTEVEDFFRRQVERESRARDERLRAGGE
jgi:hypothetical protein